MKLIGILAAFVVNTVLLGGLVVGGTQLKDARDERVRIVAAARAAAAEAKAVTAYRAALRPVVVAVYDAAQPLHDIRDAKAASIGSGYGQIRDDVLARTGIAANLRTQAKDLGAVPVPRSLTQQHATLTDCLEALIGAADKLAAATRARADKDGFVPAFSDAFFALDSGSGDWKTATSRVFLEEPVPTPASGRFDSHGRNVPSHSSYVQQADTLCAKSYEDLDGPEPTTLAAAITKLEREKRIYTTLLAGLARTRTSPADKLRVDSTIVRELTAARALTPGIDALLRAYRARDRPAARRALRQLQEATPILRDLSKAMTAYGATVCGEAFSVSRTNNADPDVTA